jgi:hypothetical protein
MRRAAVFLLLAAGLLAACDPRIRISGGSEGIDRVRIGIGL